MKKRVIISAITDLSYDQRIQKTVKTIAKSGFETFNIGTKPSTVKTRNSYSEDLRIDLFFTKGFLKFGEFNLKLLHALWKKTNQNDILWANDLDALLPNYLVSKWKNVPLVYDSHELYTEIPSVQGRYVQKIWRFLEKWLITKPNRVIAVSDSIADWYAEKYDIEKPLVVYNYPLARKKKQTTETENYLLYQGAINPGRGLIPLLESLPLLDNPIQLKIAGEGVFLEEIKKKILELDLKDRVELLGNISPTALRDITDKALLGVSLEEDKGLSYRYSLPNKLFDYIQSEIPVLATYLPEIKNIVEKYDIGEVISSHDPEEIASKIKLILSHRSAYQPGLHKSSSELVWENQEDKISALLRSL